MQCRSPSTNHYTLLGISTTATCAEIKKAYYAKIKITHPDKSAKNSDESKNEFIQLQEAYQELIDPLKRKNYDQKHNINQQGGSTPSTQFESQHNSFTSNYMNFTGIFKTSNNDLKREIKIIQPTAPKNSYYALLEIPIDASYKTIQDAWAAKHIKSQQTNDLKSQKLLAEAFQILTDDKSRKEYDKKMGVVKRRPWGIQELEDVITYNKANFATSLVLDVERYGRKRIKDQAEKITKLNLESKNPLIKAIANQAPLSEIKTILSTLSSNLKNERDLSEFKNTPAHLAVIVDRDDEKEGDLLVLLNTFGCDLSLITEHGNTLSHLVFDVYKGNSLFNVLHNLGAAQNDWEFLNLRHLKSYECNKSAPHTMKTVTP